MGYLANVLWQQSIQCQLAGILLPQKIIINAFIQITKLFKILSLNCNQIFFKNKSSDWFFL